MSAPFDDQSGLAAPTEASAGPLTFGPDASATAAVAAAADDGAPALSTAKVTALTALFTALGPISMSMYAPAMPSLAIALDTTAAMVQLTLTVYLVAFAFAQLVYGPLSDRFGRKPVLLAGVGIYLVGSVAAAAAGGIETMLAARFVQAIGVCAGTAIARAIVRDLFGGARAAQVMAALGMALTVAPAVGPVLGGHLESWFNWRAIFLFQALFGLTIAAVTVTVLPETNRRLDVRALDLAQMSRNYRQLAGNRIFMGYSVLNACLLGGMFTFAAVGPFVFISMIGLTPELYGWLMLLTTGAYFIGSTLARRDVVRIGIETLVLRGTLLTVGGSTLLLLAALLHLMTVATIIVPMMMMTMGIGMVMPGAMAGAMMPFPAIAGTASAALGFLQMGLGAVGSVAASLFGDATGWALGTIPIVLTASGLAVFLLLVRRPAAA